jgi:hypothetical protein
VPVAGHLGHRSRRGTATARAALVRSFTCWSLERSGKRSGIAVRFTAIWSFWALVGRVLGVAAVQRAVAREAGVLRAEASRHPGQQTYRTERAKRPS